MLKKLLLVYIAVATTFLVGVNISDRCTYHMYTDKELMNQFIDTRYGDDCCGVIVDDNEDEYVDFVVFENGTERYIGSMNREYYQHLYNE